MADDDHLILATSGDTRYAMPLAAMLRSVGAHLRSQCRVEVYILSDEMASRERKKVELSVPETMRLHWVKPDLGLLKDAPVHGHVTIATYFRIIAPLVLPAEAARAIYLDADVIVEADLVELWNAPMDRNVVMAVQENDWQLASPYALSFCKELGLDGTLPYLNGGVLVYDLNSWRKGEYTASVLNIIKRFEKQLRWWDQDALNAVLAGKWKALDRMWNFRVDCSVMDRRESRGVERVAIANLKLFTMLAVLSHGTFRLMRPIRKPDSLSISTRLRGKVGAPGGNG